MTKHRLSTKPGGEIPPDFSVTIKVTKKAATVVTAPTVDCPKILGIATLSPAKAFVESFLTVYIANAQADDLDVLVTSPDADVLAFLNNDSVPAYDSDTVTVTIPAGDTSVEVPFYAADTITAITITADAVGFDQASTTFQITCATEVLDIRYFTFDELVQISDGGVYPIGKIVINSNHGNQFGTQPEQIGVQDINSLLVSTCNSLEIFAKIITKNGVCPGDVITWEVGGTFSTFQINPFPLPFLDGQIPDRNDSVHLKMYADIYRGTIPTPVAFPSGANIIIQAKINGVLIDNLRATFTITFP